MVAAAKPVPLVPRPAPSPVLLPTAAKAVAAAQQSAAARVQAFEAAIEADPYDVAAWDGRLREAVQEGKPVPVFERAVQQFPTAARIWTSYAEWCETQDSEQAALAVYQRCLQQVPSLDLWSSHLTFCKRYLSLEDVLRAYQRAADLLGTDWRAGLLWAEYLALLKRAYNAQQRKENPDAEVSGKLLAEDPNPIEAARRAMKPGLRRKTETKAMDISEEEFLRVGEVLKVDVAMLRSAFQRAASSAHSVLDKLWIGYEQFEKSLGNPQVAQRLLGEHMPRYVRGKAAFKELQSICSSIDHFAVAVPLRPKNAAQQGRVLERWRGVLHYERTNPLRLSRTELQARVSLIYQQAALSCAFHAEIWYDFASWLDLGGQREEATTCLRQAVERFLPQDLALRLLVTQRHETAEAIPSPASLQAADDEYARLLEDIPKPAPLALINYLAFVRRQRGQHDFRSAFLEATESSPHCTWEVYTFAALTEYHVFGSTEAAARVFRLGLERYGEREPSLLAAYINFLVGANDLCSARAELSRGVLDRLQVGVRDRLANRSDPTVRDGLAFLWQKWARLERYFGDANAVRRAANFRDEEYRNLQRDQDVEEEAIAETPVSLGLAATINEVEESFRFQHLVPHTARVGRALAAQAPAPKPTAPAQQASSPQAQPAPADAEATGPAGPTPRDQAVAEATDEHRRLASSTPAAGLSSHIVRPDVSRMLAFRPALDIIGHKRPADTGDRQKGGLPGGNGTNGELDEQPVLPTMIPKCLQDLLAVLPARPLKGAKPDVDYLLTVLQTVSIPPIPLKDLDNFRYDSLRLVKEEDEPLHMRRFVKDESAGDGSNGFFSSKPTFYRERLQAKRQKVIEEQHQVQQPPP